MGLCALGVWQVRRRAWKLDLIARVDARVNAPPVAAPGPAAWPRVTADQDEYRHVRLTGRFLPHEDIYVQALTDFGAGSWVLTPFRTDQGFTVLVNRGFVPPDQRGSAAEGSTSEGSVIGLLRMTEPGGGFLRSNDPAHDRWFSRDVGAIAAARGLSGVAPYFVDAGATAGAAPWPRGGLTVISFPNNHLVYAITWFGLALTLCIAVISANYAPTRRTRSV